MDSQAKIAASYFVLKVGQPDLIWAGIEVAL